MVIIGAPFDRENYFMADGDLAFMLEQAGFLAKYLDEIEIGRASCRERV